MNETPRHVHFVAIGGTGMGSLAGLLAARGIRITGSDDALYPPMSTMLEQWGIPVYSGFRPEHVLDQRPDLVVIGNAVRPDNPEARAAIDEGLAYLSFPDALYQLAIAGKHSVVVSGTHGKTTTTSLLAAVLQGSGRDPSLLVGGYAHDFGGSFREGQANISSWRETSTTPPSSTRPRSFSTTARVHCSSRPSSSTTRTSIGISITSKRHSAN